MQYLIMIYEDAAAFAKRTSPDAPKLFGAYQAYSDALREAGAFVGGAPLQPPHTATTVRLQNGKRQVQDGPMADTKEQLGGYYLIEAPTLAAALDWGARCPAASYGTVEVRPIMPMQAPAS
jgi:hypothetical protein